MRKGYALVMSSILIASGSWLIAMGIMHGRFSQEQYHSLVSWTLMAGFGIILLTGSLLAFFTAQDYRAVFTATIILLSLGLFCLAVFLAFMDIMVEPGVYGILLLVFLSCYGLTMIVIGVANYFISQRVYRPFIFDLMRSLPHAYRRYRI